MKYQPMTAVWEVTMGCNMRCGHCGSSCAEALPEELTSKEALDLCDEIAQLGLRWITLSGGEPLTRKDIHHLVARLSRNGVSVNIITNGWLLEKEVAERLKKSGIATVAISIDGTREIHNQIRRQDAFEHAEDAFRILKELGIKTGAVTTITNQNIKILDELKEELIRIGVDSWQVQLGLPMGNMQTKTDWLLQPAQMEEIIQFCYETAKEGRIKICPADCIGYYTKKEMEIKKIFYHTDHASLWDGCNAGIRGFGILHNGDIMGCTSIRDRQYIEGNIRVRSLREIWEDEENFKWRRKMTKDKLSGNCRICAYGSKCLGGCPNTRLTINGDIYSENQYCAYNQKMKSLEDRYHNKLDTEELFQRADILIKNGIYQEAAFVLKRVIMLDSGQEKALLAKGYAEYMCGNYQTCLEDNEKVLTNSPENAEALRGCAIAMSKLGEKKKALETMERAVALAGEKRNEFLEDLNGIRRSR